jgi:hypothetical protein
LFARLPEAARRLIAAAPYTLYALGFEDLRFWQAACEATAAPVETRYAVNTTAWLQGSFCEIALMQAWQISAVNRLAARMLYGMSEPVAVLLAATPLWQIKQIAGNYPGLLVPRWPGNAGFWPDLLRFSQLADRAQFATAQLLGTQLIAAELGVPNRGVAAPRLFSRSHRACVLRSRNSLPLRMR